MELEQFEEVEQILDGVVSHFRSNREPTVIRMVADIEKAMQGIKYCRSSFSQGRIDTELATLGTANRALARKCCRSVLTDSLFLGAMSYLIGALAYFVGVFIFTSDETSDLQFVMGALGTTAYLIGGVFFVMDAIRPWKRKYHSIQNLAEVLRKIEDIQSHRHNANRKVKQDIDDHEEDTDLSLQLDINTTSNAEINNKLSTN